MFRYSFYKLFVFSCASVLLMLAGCDQGPATQGERSTSNAAESLTQSKNGQKKSVQQKKNKALKELAQSLALAVSDQSVRQVLQDELEEQYTGAPEALYGKIKDRKIEGGFSLRKRLAQSYATLRRQTTGKSTGAQKALRNINQYIAKIPRLHIAMPRHLDEWDAEEYTPWVTYVPQGIEDTKIKMVTAYDAEGKAHRINGKKGPGKPVLVLGINERIDADGNVLPTFQSSTGKMSTKNPLPGGGGGGGGGGGEGCNPCYETSPRESGDQQFIAKFRVIDDQEPWLKEPADIWVKIDGSKSSNINPLANKKLSETDDGASFKDRDKRVLIWYNESGNDYGSALSFEWREADGGKNSDDDLGTSTVNWEDSYTDTYGTGYVEWTVRWTD